MLAMISDLLLVAGTVALAMYCVYLSRRLKKLDAAGPNPAPVSSDTIDELEEATRSAEQARSEADAAALRLTKLIEEADRYEGELAFLLSGASNDEQAEAEKPSSVEPIFTSRVASNG